MLFLLFFSFTPTIRANSILRYDCISIPFTFNDQKSLFSSHTTRLPLATSSHPLPNRFFLNHFYALICSVDREMGRWVGCVSIFYRVFYITIYIVLYKYKKMLAHPPLLTLPLSFFISKMKLELSTPPTLASKKKRVCQSTHPPM